MGISFASLSVQAAAISSEALDTSLHITLNVVSYGVQVPTPDLRVLYYSLHTYRFWSIEHIRPQLGGMKIRVPPLRFYSVTFI